MKNKLTQYVEFLKSLDSRLSGYFEEQKEYIKCAEKCSYCCENGNYPLSELEFELLKVGISKLDRVEIKLILHKALQISEKGEKSYKCPFLKDNLCLVYKYRPLVCRSYGLLVKNIRNAKEVYELPGCMGIGLNYSEVWDNERKLFSKEKIVKLKYKTAPKIYDVGYFMVLKELEQIGYGEVKKLYEWLLSTE